MVAKVQVHVPIGCGGLGGGLACYGAHLNAAGAGVVRRRVGVLVVWGATGAHSCFALLSWLLHTEEPSTPVEEDDSNLDKDKRASSELGGKEVRKGGERER